MSHASKLSLALSASKSNEPLVSLAAAINAFESNELTGILMLAEASGHLGVVPGVAPRSFLHSSMIVLTLPRETLAREDLHEIARHVFVISADRV